MTFFTPFICIIIKLIKFSSVLSILFLVHCGKEIIEKHCSAVNIQMLLFERTCLWHKVNEREKKLGN